MFINYVTYPICFRPKAGIFQTCNMYEYICTRSASFCEGTDVSKGQDYVRTHGREGGAVAFVSCKKVRKLYPKR